jgi:3-deoxy-D-manno-octulosonic-acid transferase
MSVTPRIEPDRALARMVGLAPGEEPIWVCGSTGPGEEEIILRQYRRVLSKISRLRLVIVPRRPERFDEVAQCIEEMKMHVVRRSNPGELPRHPAIPPVVLVDTMGELRKFYGLASLVFVGRTLVDLGPRQHGSDMIEPAALARPIIVGPWTHNFADAMQKFRTANALLEINTGPDLGNAVMHMLTNPFEAAAMAKRAQQVVIHEKGATQRHVQIILETLALNPGA